MEIEYRLTKEEIEKYYTYYKQDSFSSATQKDIFSKDSLSKDSLRMLRSSDFYLDEDITKKSHNKVIDLSNLEAPNGGAFALPEGLICGELDLTNSNCAEIAPKTEVGIIYLEGLKQMVLPDDLKCNLLVMDEEVARALTYKPDDVRDIAINIRNSEGQEQMVLLNIPTKAQVLNMQEKAELSDVFEAQIDKARNTMKPLRLRK